MKTQNIRYITVRDYPGDAPLQDPLAYYHLLTTPAKQSNRFTKWLRNIVGRFL